MLMHLFGFIFTVFRFSCLLYFLRDKFTFVPQTFNWVCACKDRLMHYKAPLYCIAECFWAVVIFQGYPDSLFSLDIFGLKINCYVG